ncbi:MAG: DnaJ domain-containing protein [Pseudomonadota bacterium]
MKKKTLYEFLGVEPSASPDEIKTAAQYLAKKFNPTQYPGNFLVVERFKKIKLVYNILANPQKRAVYDASLAKKMAQSEPGFFTPTQKKDKNWEQMIYSADIHWFAYIEALLLMTIPAYFLFFDAELLHNLLKNIEFLKDKRLYVEMGLPGLLVLTILMLQHSLLRQFSTTLLITSRRTISKFGLISRKKLEITHAQFEDIKIKQSILGKILDFGTIKMRGISGNDGSKIKIKMSNVASPKVFEKYLRRIIKHNAYHRIE